MGLGFSHGDAHWSYSGFMNFRDRIVKTIDPNSNSTLRDLYNSGEYKKFKDDPIFILIDHSDCEGEISVEDMKILLPRLVEIISKWKDSDDFITKYDYHMGKLLCEGMEMAIIDNVPIEFC